MFLIDTNVISELRKKDKADIGVVTFFTEAKVSEAPCYLSVITLGELRRGIEMIRHRGDIKQAEAMLRWFEQISNDYADLILPIDRDVASMWAMLRVPNYENALDKLIAATALMYSLQVVTRNTKVFERSGVGTVNPFLS
ncbi:hypothetical protein AB833_05160 [Chromatiales bacterium (ex Bugula neritina AB1)]|nr:hypothetical protein AB833_05160 [Chromatiales bacterium (ex Bugula neritina AB1)]